VDPFQGGETQRAHDRFLVLVAPPVAVAADDDVEYRGRCVVVVSEGEVGDDDVHETEGKGREIEGWISCVSLKGWIWRRWA